MFGQCQFFIINTACDVYKCALVSTLSEITSKFCQSSEVLEFLVPNMLITITMLLCMYMPASTSG